MVRPDGRNQRPYQLVVGIGVFAALLLLLWDGPHLKTTEHRLGPGVRSMGRLRRCRSRPACGRFAVPT